MLEDTSGDVYANLKVVSDIYDNINSRYSKFIIAATSG
jgi:hypothetical protein